MTRRLTWPVLAILIASCGDRSPRPADSTIAAPVDSQRERVIAQIPLPLRVLGTEPFWALDIDSTGLRFITPDDTTGIRFPPLAPSALGDTVVWAGQTERADVEARIWRGQCSDGMSDRVYPYVAAVRIAGTSYRGCADKRL